MPGIVISTAVRTGPTSTTVRESSQAFFVGQAYRGPDDVATRVNSLEEFELSYGGYVSGAYLHPIVESFFEEGGSQCYIARTVASDAATGSLELLDTNDDTTITLTARGTGVWSDSIKVEVVEGTVVDSVIVKIYQTTNGVDRQIMTTGNCVSVGQIVGKINTNAVASLMLTATDGETGLLPVTIAKTALDGGSDGVAPITDALYISSLELFNDSYGTGVVICAESSTDTMSTALVAHANEYNRMTFLYTLTGDTQDDAITKAQTVQADENAEHAALFFPWVYAPTSVTGISRLIPPVGYAAGARARAHNQTGPHQPGAGIISNARFVKGVEFDLNKTQGDTLDEVGVNAIRIINNVIRIYGARSLSIDIENFRYYNAQDVLNYVVVEAGRTLEDVLFTVIDSRSSIFVNVESRLTAILEGLRDIGALYEAFDVNGRRIDYGYTVKCNASLNPLARLSEGTVTARVGLRVSSIGDSIQVDIIKSNLSASVV
jgi:phage tail sheath protein FI